MTKETKQRILHIYRILLAVIIIIAGLCLMAGCLSIYTSGDQPFSREAVAAVFSKIAIPVYACLIMIVLGFLLELVLRPNEDTVPVKKVTLNKDMSDPEAVAASDKKIRIARCVVLALGLGLTVLGLATGGIADVLAKAVNICTECIGLG